ncbi:hypothetical protein A2858_02710 [Candidatus Daviesbacteria bacterium RIFCSPHIGHO2_01_FULL_36_37]|uniref:Uncharacterized protein n=3 Tax=Candidatus Daviesiibacteriota TaxID=1752718 RepID=A0A0G0EKP9_9BACT|nr:MAG: hypothetical protein US19_C0041G0019 [Candidatus Daviesbacteria bacterium GW2011_GWB1_36_5]KKQ15234.1 MAG: hypothetical protein US28_C0020G0014 [Candidatus Daviesbacteria bacterium GW2011_GWA1_36_8]OGE17634.1 MAG: hypothetical protein A2858_02710 [Candidatus Daviesbacteria bacterium RIFCSPHIGHO2_01_FULL_36_37]
MKKIIGFLRKLRPLDYIIILIILLSILFLSRYVSPDEEWVDVLIVDDRLPTLLATSFQNDDTEKNLTGKEVAKIIDAQSFNSAGTSGSIQDVFLEVKLLAKINPRTKQFEFKNRAVTPGLPIELNFPSGTIRGVILSMGDNLKIKKIKTKKLTLKLYSEWPWLAESIKQGDTLLDRRGNKIVEILEKSAAPSAYADLTLGESQTIKVNPEKIDITLKVSIQVYETAGGLIAWNTKRILVGETLDFSTKNTTFHDVVITEIND